MTTHQQDLLDSCETLIRHLNDRLDVALLDLVRDDLSSQLSSLSDLRGDIRREIEREMASGS
jgi:hypothetical protein